ncbi:hypothetical protein GCM10009853_093720 [Glycomyces scopariae]
MTAIDGFWSYSHADDEAESGRIAQLARDVRSQFELLTGESIELFLDRDQLVWGDDWRPKVDASLMSIAFFVPVLTPRYFMSAECRRELNYFARGAERLGVKELVLPLLWVDMPALKAEDPADDLIGLVKRFQWIDWTNLKFSETSSGEYRRAVNELAHRLVDANTNAAQRPANLAQVDDIQEDADEPGTLDKLAAMEESVPDMVDLLVGVAGELNRITEVVQSATDDMGVKGGASTAVHAAKLRVARSLAVQLEEPSGNIRSLGGRFSSSLNEIDEGVRIIIERSPEESAADAQTAEQFQSFFQVIRELVGVADTALGEIAGMIRSIEPAERMSRDLRKPLRTLREGLTLMVDGFAVMQVWVGLIDEVERPGAVAAGADEPDHVLPE